MANKAEIEVEVNAEIYRIALESKLIIERFQKLLGVYTTREALAKIAVLMREEALSESLLSKALGHLQSCSCQGSQFLCQEIASAFGESGLTPLAPDVCSACNGTGIDPNDNDLYCEPCGGMGRSNAGKARRSADSSRK